MLERLPLSSSGAAASGSCLQLQSRSRGVKESRSWEANRRPHLSGRNLGRRWAIPGLPDLSICRPGNLANEQGGTTPKEHKNNTIEPSMSLKTQEAIGKRTQNEPNFERQMHRLNPNSKLSSEPRVRAGGLRLEMPNCTEAIRSRKPGGSREKHKNNTNEPGMLLKTKDGYGKPLVRASR